MEESAVHTFHIPVLGLAFSIDTPLRVGRFGISSVISLVDDVLIERMRQHHARLHGEPYTAITPHHEDHRARRITEYLNLLNRLLREQTARLKASAFESGSDIVKYFEMLADQSPLKKLYREMLHTPHLETRAGLENELRARIVPGAIDVNIMTKLDKVNRGPQQQELPADSTDALASLRGFVRSDLESSVILSAGLNPRLFSYMGECPEFLPDRNGHLKKKVILKVSDYRSGLIQGKVLAKKGIWTSEFRIESGLNCGGHAFATDGYLLGPILEEFKSKRSELNEELFSLYAAALRGKEIAPPPAMPPIRVTVQGGIGTAQEDSFLRDFFGVDGTGWGSPFLLVPEATNVDADTRSRLSAARQEDFYLSKASPLGIPFQNFRGSSSEEQRRRRVEAGKPGSPCTKKYLISNTEFTKEPICTASRQYQSLKIAQLKGLNLPAGELAGKIESVVEKSCLCEDLSASVLPCGDSETDSHAVAICPGPNLAFFSKTATLEEMVAHIYGRYQLIAVPDRPHMFINELRLYVNYLKAEVQSRLDSLTNKEQKHFDEFRANLQKGIAYYRGLLPRLAGETDRCREAMRLEMLALEHEIESIFAPLTMV